MHMQPTCHAFHVPSERQSGQWHRHRPCRGPPRSGVESTVVPESLTDSGRWVWPSLGSPLEIARVHTAVTRGIAQLAGPLEHDKYQRFCHDLCSVVSLSSAVQQNHLLGQSSPHHSLFQHTSNASVFRQEQASTFFQDTQGNNKIQPRTVNMKFSATAVALLASTVAAAPLVERQTSSTINELDNGGCRPYIIFHARGTGQAGNIGQDPGPQLIAAVKASLGAANVAGQGVPYGATVFGNLAAGGVPAADGRAFAAQINAAVTKCPSSKIFVAGYSQGAALVHRAVEQLSTAVKAKIAAAVTFGDSQKQQDGGRIPTFDTSKTLIICRTGDRICEGTLIITSFHQDYSPLAPQGAAFMVSKA
ncbi:cutinase [Microdochium nivale]|nr:cutinase [Microdochium nivale]